MVAPAAPVLASPRSFGLGFGLPQAELQGQKRLNPKANCYLRRSHGASWRMAAVTRGTEKGRSIRVVMKSTGLLPESPTCLCVRGQEPQRECDNCCVNEMADLSPSLRCGTSHIKASGRRACKGICRPPGLHRAFQKHGSGPVPLKKDKWPHQRPPSGSQHPCDVARPRDRCAPVPAQNACRICPVSQ